MKNEAEERRGSPPATAADLSFPSSTWMERDLRDGRMKRRAARPHLRTEDTDERLLHLLPADVNDDRVFGSVDEGSAFGRRDRHPPTVRAGVAELRLQRTTEQVDRQEVLRTHMHGCAQRLERGLTLDRSHLWRNRTRRWAWLSVKAANRIPDWLIDLKEKRNSAS